MKPTTRYAIIGAGPSGLIAARAFKFANIDFDVLEKHSEVGGIWDMKNEGTPMYEAAHFISSKTQSGFPDYDMPQDYPDYPSYAQIFDYIKDFSIHYGLRSHILFDKKIISLEKNIDTSWKITAEDGFSQNYKGVLICPGTNWFASMPNLKGHFSGIIRHGQTFKKSAEFTGKKILVIGGGNSGIDIACEAATHAEKAFLSIRRAYWFVPKHIFGKPTDVFAAEGPKVPVWLQQWFFAKIIRLNVGKQSRYGLPQPDHRLLESHPILNTDIFSHLSHGKMTVKNDVDYLDGKNVVFKDGSREEIDEIICATGYQHNIPFASDFFDWENNRPIQQYLQIFSRKHANLFTFGMLETNSAGYVLLTEQANLLANYIKSSDANEKEAVAFNQLIATDTSNMLGSIRLIVSERATNYVDSDTIRAYMKKLQLRFGWQAYKVGQYQ